MERFGKFMKGVLGYRKIEYNVQILNKDSRKTMYFDIHGIRGGHICEMLMKVNIAFLTIFSLLSFMEFKFIDLIMDNVFFRNEPNINSIITTFIVFILILLFGQCSMKKSQHAVVKVFQDEVIRKDKIKYIIDELNTMAKNKNIKYKINSLILVTSYKIEDNINLKSNYYKVEVYKMDNSTFNKIS